MKRDDMYDAVTNIDDDIIEEAKILPRRRKAGLPRYWKQITCAAAAVVLVCVIAVALLSTVRMGSSASDMSLLTEDYNESGGTNGIAAEQDIADAGVNSYDYNSYDAKTAAGTTSSPQEANEDGSTDMPASGQKLVKTLNITAQTKDFDKCMQSITQKASELGGYVESSSMSGLSEQADRTASVTLRIPSGSLDDMTGIFSDILTITYSSETTKDVTLDYVDTESRLKALRTEQDALLRLLEEADKLSDVMTLQSQLTNVRYQIESYESRMRTMENKVSYATVKMSIYETDKVKKVDKSFTGEVKSRFMNSIDSIINAARSFAIWFIGSLPYIVIIAIVVIIVLLIIRKIRRKKYLSN